VVGGKEVSRLCDSQVWFVGAGVSGGGREVGPYGGVGGEGVVAVGGGGG